MSHTITDHPDLPSGWFVEVAVNRFGQGAAVVFDQDGKWVVEGRTVEEAVAEALGG